MNVEKALVIAEPWIGYLLSGLKTWEMRSTATSHRGWFGLIRKGSGHVQAVARLAEVGSPLTPAEMIDCFEKHRIPAGMISAGVVSKWNVPWKLTDIHVLPSPVTYHHKSGAVTWVSLDPAASTAIRMQFGEEEVGAREDTALRSTDDAG